MRKLFYPLSFALLLIFSGCVLPEDQRDYAKDAVETAMAQPEVSELKAFGEVFNNPLYRSSMPPEQAEIVFRMEVIPQLVGKNKYNVGLRLFFGDSPVEENLWFEVDAGKKIVLAKSPSFASSNFFASMREFMASDEMKRALTVVSIASALKPIESCEYWDDPDLCFFQFAKLREKPLFCNMVALESERLKCFASVQKEPSFCAALSEEDKWQCQVISANSFDDCSKILVPADFNAGEGVLPRSEQCFFSLAQNNPALSDDICTRIQDTAARDTCISMQAGDLDKPSLCDKISGDKNQCLAVATNDAKPCEDSKSGRCFYALALDRLDPVYCNYSGETWACVNDVAVMKNDRSLCEAIPADVYDLRKSCYTFTAETDEFGVVKKD